MGRLHVVKPPQYALTSVDNALQTLLMMQEQDGVGVSEVAARIGVTPSTAHRILSTLVYRGFAGRDDSHRYFLGPAMNGVVRGPHALEVVLRPHLVKLRDETDGTASAMVRRGMSVRILTTIEPTHAHRVTNRAGTTLPLEASATGRSMLAGLSRADLHHLFTGPRANLSGTTLSPAQLAELEGELARIRASGFSYNDRLTELDLVAVACAVPTRGRQAWLSIAVAVPAEQAGLLRNPACTRALRRAVEAIASDLEQRGIVDQPDATHRGEGAELPDVTD